MGSSSGRSLLLAALLLAAAPHAASPAGRSMAGSGNIPSSSARKDGANMGSMGHTREPEASMDDLDAAVTATCSAKPDTTLDHPMEPCLKAYLARAEAHKENGELLAALVRFHKQAAVISGGILTDGLH
jgi:hypothetical protein